MLALSGISRPETKRSLVDAGGEGGLVKVRDVETHCDLVTGARLDDFSPRSLPSIACSKISCRIPFHARMQHVVFPTRVQTVMS